MTATGDKTVKQTGIHTSKKLSTYCSMYTPQSLKLFCCGTLGLEPFMTSLEKLLLLPFLTSHSTSKYLQLKTMQIKTFVFLQNLKKKPTPNPRCETYSLSVFTTFEREGPLSESISKMQGLRENTVFKHKIFLQQLRKHNVTQLASCEVICGMTLNKTRSILWHFASTAIIL